MYSRYVTLITQPTYTELCNIEQVCVCVYLWNRTVSVWKSFSLHTIALLQGTCKTCMFLYYSLSYRQGFANFCSNIDEYTHSKSVRSPYNQFPHFVCIVHKSPQAHTTSIHEVCIYSDNDITSRAFTSLSKVGEFQRLPTVQACIT
jgi:hypothetical protein